MPPHWPQWGAVAPEVGVEGEVVEVLAGGVVDVVVGLLIEELGAPIVDVTVTVTVDVPNDGQVGADTVVDSEIVEGMELVGVTIVLVGGGDVPPGIAATWSTTRLVHSALP
jgi:hypothetical protein